MLALPTTTTSYMAGTLRRLARERYVGGGPAVRTQRCGNQRSASTSAAKVEVFALAKTFFTLPSGPMTYATRFALPPWVVSAAPYCTPVARVGSDKSG